MQCLQKKVFKKVIFALNNRRNMNFYHREGKCFAVVGEDLRILRTLICCCPHTRDGEWKWTEIAESVQKWRRSKEGSILRKKKDTYAVWAGDMAKKYKCMTKISISGVKFTPSILTA